MNKEELYNKFVTDVMPKLQDGLVISKDYFMDLFERYITYKLTINSIWLLIFIFTFVLSVFLLYKHIKIEKDKRGSYDIEDNFTLLVIVFGLLLIIGMFIIGYTLAIIKLNYIPELTVYEDLFKKY